MSEDYALLKDQSLPKPIRNFLQKGGRLEEIKLDALGRWFHQGERFRNEKLIKMFHKSISQTPGGTWILKVGRFTYPIVIEDVPYFIRRIEIRGAQLWAILSDDTEEVLRIEALCYKGEGKLYTRVKDQKYWARLDRQAYLFISQYFVEQNNQIVFQWNTLSIPLSTLDDQPIAPCLTSSSSASVEP